MYKSMFWRSNDIQTEKTQKTLESILSRVRKAYEKTEEHSSGVPPGFRWKKAFQYVPIPIDTRGYEQFFAKNPKFENNTFSFKVQEASKIINSLPREITKEITKVSALELYLPTSTLYVFSEDDSDYCWIFQLKD
jgi:hypothetical protein